MYMYIVYVECDVGIYGCARLCARLWANLVAMFSSGMSNYSDIIIFNDPEHKKTYTTVIYMYYSSGIIRILYMYIHVHVYTCIYIIHTFVCLYMYVYKCMWPRIIPLTDYSISFDEYYTCTLYIQSGIVGFDTLSKGHWSSRPCLG